MSQNPDNSMFLEKAKELLTPQEIDALGEIGNISMGAAATTLSTVLNKRVEISTPVVEIIDKKELEKSYDNPSVVIEIYYVDGLKGGSLFTLKTDDVKVITDIMFGGPGEIKEGELDELSISAMNEIMNQMIGSSAIALSEMFSTTISISTPQCTLMPSESDKAPDLFSDEDKIVRISFRLEIEDCLKSKFVQVMQFDSAKDLITRLIRANNLNKKSDKNVYGFDNEHDGKNVSSSDGSNKSSSSQKQMVEIRKPSFAHFDDSTVPSGENLGIVMNVPINVSIELGRTKKTIQEILEFKHGSLIVLDRVAGDAVDIVVNGKLMAKGEVIIVDDNYGVRITDIVKTEIEPHF